MPQTPIKSLRLEGLELYAVDWTNKSRLIATAADKEAASWLLWTCASLHGCDSQVVE